MTKRLKNQDWKNLFSALSILHSDIEPKTLSERCIATANKIISAEITAFDFFDARGFHTGGHWYDPPDAISEAEFEIFAHVAHEHPFTPAVFGNNQRSAMATSDFLTTTRFHQTAIYNEYYKIYSIDHQLLVGFPIAPNSVLTCVYNRTKSNFTEEERLIFEMLSQHLQIVIQNAHKIERFHQIESNLNLALESKSGGVIVLNANKQIVYESEFARRMLETYFTEEKSASGMLPDTLSRWFNNEYSKFGNEKIALPPEIYKTERQNTKLEISLIWNDGRQEITLLFEETLHPIMKMSQHLSLTRREIEILFWLSCGKTNKEIGKLLFISPRTVNKHAENIYRKLGVENRAAAVSLAFEKLS